MKLSKTSLAVLVIQILLVVSIAGKYLYQRSTCPRVWTRAAMYDPELIMRGRYLSMQLEVDACQQGDTFPTKLVVQNDRLVAVRTPESEDSTGRNVFATVGQSCDAMRLSERVNFYIPEHANSPLPVKPGQELWVEVTVPPKGPPRPIQLALKDHGAWKPLAFQ